MPNNVTFEWNSAIRRAHPLHALSLYARSMLRSAARPNKFTFTFLLQAILRLPSTAAAAPLRRLHAHLTEHGLHSDPFLRSALIAAYAHSNDIPTVDRLFLQGGPRNDVVVRTALVTAYARCAMPDDARRAFDAIPRPNPVSWAALLSAYARAGRHRDALSTFRRMRRAGVDPTEAALVTALAAAARAGSLVDGHLAHHCAILGGSSAPGPALGTALLEMYARCGNVDVAEKVFDAMPLRDQQAYAAMISALAAHGRGGDALQLFERMVGPEGFAPDHVAWVVVLHACSHAGLVTESRKHLERMVQIYGAAPQAEHYGCVVDALGRAGQAEEAWEVVQAMPVEPDEHVLKSLLSVCCACGLMDRAERVAEKLMALDAGHAAAYVLLSNAFAELGRWDEVARVRKLMRNRGVPKFAGSSAVD